MLFVFDIDCSQPLFKHAKEKVSEATLKHLGVSSEVCEQREQEELIDCKAVL